ncbi:P-loop NTPase fold protein, partial [Brachyspira hampsonii]
MENIDKYFKNIKNTIKNYLAEKNTDYGIMLTGEWGCGKTYFVKNLLKLYKYKKLYISISGKENILEIVDDIYLSSLIKKFNSNDISLNTTKTILNNVSGILVDTIPIGKDIGKNILNILKEINKNIDKLKNVFLIIDDVERISKKINIEDLLYSIYDNFISNNVKVLFICNEEVLINNEEYNKIKEKIIRHTIKLHSIDKNNFKLFLETYIIKNLIYDKDIE